MRSVYLALLNKFSEVKLAESQGVNVGKVILDIVKEHIDGLD